ncbi:MAG: hypothetical protein JZU72_02035 [Chlorobium phaeobacteroides]|jgi:hypothetical protein|nr:hypothetical protein [Chlorobium phaeobacteroides]
MSKSLLACAIGTTQSTIARINISENGAIALSSCTTIQGGVHEITEGRNHRAAKKLLALTKEWKNDPIALTLSQTEYRTLPAYFPSHAGDEVARELCAIEAEHFLLQPERYRCEHLTYGENGIDCSAEKKLLLFYPAEPIRIASAYFSKYRPVMFSGSPLLPLVHLSRYQQDPLIILELEKNFVLLCIAHKGRMNYFSYRRVENQSEKEYFSLQTIKEASLFHHTVVQVTGTGADMATTALIEKETGCRLNPLALPEALSGTLVGVDSTKEMPSSAIQAISTALMALALRQTGATCVSP